MNCCRTSLLVVSLAVCVSAPAFGQDAVKVDPGHYKVILENASVACCGSTMRQGQRA